VNPQLEESAQFGQNPWQTLKAITYLSASGVLSGACWYFTAIKNYRRRCTRLALTHQPRRFGKRLRMFAFGDAAGSLAMLLVSIGDCLFYLKRFREGTADAAESPDRRVSDQDSKRETDRGKRFIRSYGSTDDSPLGGVTKQFAQTTTAAVAEVTLKLLQGELLALLTIRCGKQRYCG